MHVLDTYKFKTDQINSKREKVNHRFLDPKAQLTLWSVVKSGNISNSSKLSSMSLLPASMNRIRSRTAEKKLQNCFSHYKSMSIFHDSQGQLTLVVGSSRISNSSECSCMSMLPASMERNGCKTAEKKWRHCFSHHNPICYHGNQ